MEELREVNKDWEIIMRVWIVSDGEPLPIDGKNTRLRRMGNLAKFINSVGHSVTWFSTTYDHHHKQQRAFNDIKVSLGENYSLNLSFVREYKKNVSIGRLMSRHEAAYRISSKFSDEEKPDIIIATMAHVELTNYACAYGIKYNIPVIVDVRDLWPVFIIDMVKTKYKPFVLPYVKYHEYKLSGMMKNAYAILGLSDFFLEYGLKYAKRDKKEVDAVIPIGYPNYDYLPYKDNLETYWSDLKEDDFIIACTGTFSHQFDYNAVVEASIILQEKSDIKFVLCGAGTKYDAVKAKVGSNVSLPGWVEKDKISSLLINSQIGLIPYIDGVNYRGNTPNKFGEYLSASLPILVSLSGSMESLLSEFHCGFHYENGEKLAELIIKYRNDRILCQEHKKNARALYELKFNGDKVNKELFTYITFVHETYLVDIAKHSIKF